MKINYEAEATEALRTRRPVVAPSAEQAKARKVALADAQKAGNRRTESQDTALGKLAQARASVRGGKIR